MESPGSKSHRRWAERARPPIPRERLTDMTRNLRSSRHALCNRYRPSRKLFNNAPNRIAPQGSNESARHMRNFIRSGRRIADGLGRRRRRLAGGIRNRVRWFLRRRWRTGRERWIRRLRRLGVDQTTMQSFKRFEIEHVGSLVFVVDAGSSTPRGWHATRRHISQPSSPAMHMPSVSPPDYGRMAQAPKEKRPSRPDIFRYRSRQAFRMKMTTATTATIISRRYPPCRFRSFPHPMP